MDAAAPNNQTPIEVDDGPPRRPSSPSPVQPLAPLEYLQNQRRGSITDPSLHASPPDPSASNHHHPPLTLSPEQRTKRSPRTLRPTSPFVFGDASVHPPDLSSPNIRRLFRSPSNETIENRPDELSRNRELPAPSGPQDRRVLHDEFRSKPNSDSPREVRSDPSANMDVTHHDTVDPKHRSASGHSLAGPASAATHSADFDYSMRRHSIAEHPPPSRGMSHPPDAPHPPDMPPPSRSPGIPSLPHGLKRKMSSDRALYPMGEETDHPHQGIMPDNDGPAPKRRGSAFDAHRMAHLSLYDRRDSVDSRSPQGQPPQWWMSDRRDSASSMFSNTSTGGYSSPGFSGDSAYPARQGLANIAWSPHPPSAAPNHEAEVPMSGLPRHLQARGGGSSDSPIPSLSPVPSTMPPDRRMSVPEVSAANRPRHNLRSKSRPPAPPIPPPRNSERQPSTNPSDGDGMAEDGDASPTQGQMQSNPHKEGTSPYSRSPELRVSHKLAERKRRKEMKDLFDELRDQLPADRGMKASKWEILTKAVDHISSLKQAQQDMSREIEMLRHELEVARSGGQYQQGSGGTHTGSHPAVYGQAGVAAGSPYAHPPGLPQQQQPTDSSPAT